MAAARVSTTGAVIFDIRRGHVHAHSSSVSVRARGVKTHAVECKHGRTSSCAVLLQVRHFALVKFGALASASARRSRRLAQYRTGGVRDRLRLRGVRLDGRDAGSGYAGASVRRITPSQLTLPPPHSRQASAPRATEPPCLQHEASSGRLNHVRSRPRAADKVAPRVRSNLPEVVQAPDVSEQRNDMLHVPRLGRVHLARVQASAISAPAQVSVVPGTHVAYCVPALLQVATAPPPWLSKDVPSRTTLTQQWRSA